jgi:hypothetical protein
VLRQILKNNLDRIEEARQWLKQLIERDPQLIGVEFRYGLDPEESLAFGVGVLLCDPETIT